MTSTPTRPTVRIDGADYPFVDPDAISRGDLRWLSKVAGKLHAPRGGGALDRAFRAASKTPNFTLRRAIASIQVGLIRRDTWKREESPSEALERVVRILLPDAPPTVLGRMPHRQAEALAEAFMTPGGAAQ